MIASWLKDAASPAGLARQVRREMDKKSRGTTIKHGVWTYKKSDRADCARPSRLSDEESERKMIKASIIIIAFFSGVVFAQNTAEKKGISILEEKREKGKIVWKQKETHFKVRSERGNDASGLPLYSLFEEVSIKEWNNQSEGGNFIIQTKKWGFDGKRYENLIWKIEAPGEDPEVDENFYLTTKYGCCGDVNRYSYFSVRSGKRIGVYNDKLVPMPLGNRIRFLGYMVADHLSGPDSSMARTLKSHGILFLLNDSTEIFKKHVVVSGDVWFPPKIEVNQKSINLSFEDGANLKLKIDGDSLVTEK
jgi:hypothetical protein